MYLQNKLRIAITGITVGGGFNHTNKTNEIIANKNRFEPPNFDAFKDLETQLSCNSIHFPPLFMFYN